MLPVFSKEVSMKRLTWSLAILAVSLSNAALASKGASSVKFDEEYFKCGDGTLVLIAEWYKCVKSLAFEAKVAQPPLTAGSDCEILPARCAEPVPPIERVLRIYRQRLENDHTKSLQFPNRRIQISSIDLDYQINPRLIVLHKKAIQISQSSLLNISKNSRDFKSVFPKFALESNLFSKSVKTWTIGFHPPKSAKFTFRQHRQQLKNNLTTPSQLLNRRNQQLFRIGQSIDTLSTYWDSKAKLGLIAFDQKAPQMYLNHQPNALNSSSYGYSFSQAILSNSILKPVTTLRIMPQPRDALKFAKFESLHGFKLNTALMNNKIPSNVR
jgi:hypothetical protein